MNKSRNDFAYKLYQVYVWGGLPLIVIYIVIAVLVFRIPDVVGSMAILVIMGPFYIWFSGILLFWWWVILRGSKKELDELTQTQVGRIPDINSLKNWNTLYRKMAICGGNKEDLIKYLKKANRPIIIWYGSSNLIAIWICGFITLGSMGYIQGNSFPIMVIVVVFWIVLMMILTYFLLGWGGKSAEKALLAPLNLAVTQNSVLKPGGMGLVGYKTKWVSSDSTTIEGEHHGRFVHIETMGKRSLTILSAKLPEFKVSESEGKFSPNGKIPQRIEDALKYLRKAKRWQGVEISASSEGISVIRESKGTRMWLYDLWLAEYILEKMNNP